MGDTKIYKQNNLTFILTLDKIIVRTSLPQTFFLEASAYYWLRRVALIRNMIQLGEIRSLNELSSFCANGQILWITTRVNYPIDNEN